MADSISGKTFYAGSVSRSLHDPSKVISLAPFSKNYLSCDSGKTWQSTNDNIGDHEPIKIFWHPYRAGEFWVTIAGYELFGYINIYRDYGKELFTSIELTDIDSADCCNSIGSLVFDKQNPEHVIAFNLEHILETFDGGINWAINDSLVPDSMQTHYVPVVGEDTKKSGFYFLFELDYEGENGFVKNLYYTDDYFKTFKRHPFFDSHRANINSGHRVQVHGDHLFLGTDKGVYQIPLSEFE